MLDAETVGKTIFMSADKEDASVIYNAIKDSAAECDALATSMIVACCMVLGEEVTDSPPRLHLREGIIALLDRCTIASDPAEEDNDE